MHTEMATSYYRRNHRGDDALLICGRAVNYARYMAWYLKNVQNLPMAANNDLMKCAHVCPSLRRRDGSASRSPLNVKSTDLYNIVNGQVAPTKVNIQDAFHIGITQSEKFAALLPDAFHGKTERKGKTMR